VEFLVLPELGVTGYSCGDLFAQKTLLRASKEALLPLAKEAKRAGLVAVVGLPFAHRGRLYNCGAVLAGGKVAGLVPKQYLPDASEYYERRWFTPGLGLLATEVEILGQKVPFGTNLLFMDADMFFFSDPGPVEREVEASSIAITPHRFRPELASHRKYGIYNVGWLSFRADGEGKECLAEWRRQCLEWCRDEPERGRFGDQGYLDAWPEKYPKTQVVDQPGFNEAPWNVDVDKITKNNGKIFIGNHPLVLFHFQGLRRISPRLFNPNWHDYGLRPSRKLIRWIYQPYLSTVLSVEKKAEMTPQGQKFVRGRNRDFPTNGRRRGGTEGIRSLIKLITGRYLWGFSCQNFQK